MRMINSIIECLASQATFGLRIVGCRRSGKSYLAEHLHTSLGKNSELLDAAALFHGYRCRGASSLVTSPSFNPIDREIQTRLHRARTKGGLTLIIDNAEVLLGHMSDELMLQVIEAVNDNMLQLVIVRNRFIRESNGLLCARESNLARLLPRFDITPLEGNDGIRTALTFFGSTCNTAPDRAAWLFEWSGGLPGLMFDLKPLTPPMPLLHNCPKALLDHCLQTALDLALHTPVRKAIIAAAHFNLLAPDELLQPSAAAEVGLLCALGMLNPSYTTADSPFQGRFWASVAATIINSEIDVPGKYFAVAQKLESLLVEAHLKSEIADELGCRGRERLSPLLERALYTEMETTIPTIGFGTFLSQTVGRAGLRRILWAAGRSPKAGLGSTDLSREVMSLARSGAS
jgi:hypothetical protein